MSHFLTAPQTAPQSVNLVIVDPTSATVSWTPATLAEARGFIVSYSVSYVPTGLTDNQQEVMVPENQSSFLITGLELMMEYSITVMTHTSAGPSDGTTLILLSKYKSSKLILITTFSIKYSIYYTFSVVFGRNT